MNKLKLVQKDGKDGVLAPLIKQLTEAALQAELESHLTTEINKKP